MHTEWSSKGTFMLNSATLCRIFWKDFKEHPVPFQYMLARIRLLLLRHFKMREALETISLSPTDNQILSIKHQFGLAAEYLYLILKVK